MIHLTLLLILLFIGCSTEPEDCGGIAGGSAIVDICGVCNGDGSPCYIQGETITQEHQNMEFNFCYPSDSLGETFSFSEHSGKVFMLEMSASW